MYAIVNNTPCYTRQVLICVSVGTIRNFPHVCKMLGWQGLGVRVCPKVCQVGYVC